MRLNKAKNIRKGQQTIKKNSLPQDVPLGDGTTKSSTITFFPKTAASLKKKKKKLQIKILSFS